ncbi:methylenetetrahydrofolate reductase [Syntrophobotulus glycolicus DSM 8271]|uniref:Methylenetetrahydrofolate reductase n=1 Tax=Syntrophobotulus glycolicus (strain DSM 8271 / FlGlyR) TaxID=645991 RepID=F0SUR8_SYNGF|nr:methylenetetrahydrofolate reductase [Syntrophobotulus glycolicus]ADY56634.1 methylenetetrahydrofolate reductase [Syntrophobotulus glycolicus DSM 8271]
MNKIAVELVPRDERSLISELSLINSRFPLIKTINFPDLLRFDLRSWEGCRIAQRYFQDVIPHIRAMDIKLSDELPMQGFLIEHKINQVLVVTGDLPQDMTKKIYPSTSIEVIKKFKREMPGIKVYAAVDPYRKSVREELEYIRRKLEAGADGFFTQPFFDLRLMEIYAEILDGCEVFWGISPVTGEKSVNYWETKNNVVFPRGFEPTLKWNVNFAKQALALTESRKDNIYFMPIRTGLEEYLRGIFG